MSQYRRDVAPAVQDGTGKQNDRILLVTDSTSDLPEELVRERNITVVPLTINIDGREYRDGVDISSREFYRLLQSAKAFPVTSPPSGGDFHRLFLDNIAEKDILGIFISRGMSKTFDLANQATRNNFNSYLRQRRTNPAMANQFRIELIDSRQVSMGTALLVLEASDKIRAGWPLPQIKSHIERLIAEVRVFFMVDNLDYLARGGRIGRGAALLGNFFGFKPILGMTGGGVDAKSRTFGGGRAQRKLIDYMKDDLRGRGGAIRVGICHADSAEKAETVRNLVEQAFPDQEQIVSYFGPTVGSHLGPGAVGVAWLPVSAGE
jgi:DegV family protein with EDD domain